MKSHNHFQLNRIISLVSLCLGFVVFTSSVSADNPYSSGGGKYGGEPSSLESANYDYSGLGSGQGYSSNNNIQPNSSSLFNAGNPQPSPYNQSSNPSIGQSTYQNNSMNVANQTQTSPYQNNNSSAIPPARKPWDKMGSWIQDKRTKDIEDPEKNVANQRIEAGKSRIKALKAKEKLDKHIADSEAKTQELRREVEQAEQQADFLENQLKFQESNISQSQIK
jgi:hypothetical protein